MLRYAMQGTALGLVVMAAVLFATIAPSTAHEIRKFPFRYVPVILLLVFGAWASSGIRIWVLTRPMGYRMTWFQALITGIAAEFGVTATPGGVGATVIRLSFMMKGGVPLTESAAILSADAVLDFAFFILLAPFALVMIFHDPDWSVAADQLRSIPFGLILAGVLLVLLTAALLLLRGGRWIRSFESVLRHSPNARARRLAVRFRHARWRTRKEVRRIYHTTTYVFQKHFLAMTIAFVLTCLQWICRFSILPVILLAYTNTDTFLPLLVLQGILLGLSFVILLPGGGGIVEMITTLVLRQFVPIPAVGIILILWRFFTYHLFMLGGGVTFFLSLGNMKRLFPPAPAKG